MQTKVEQFSDRINEFLRKAKGSTYDKAAVIYNIIEESADSKEAFIYFLENANDIDSSEEKEVDAYFTAQKLKKYETEYSELIDGLLNKTILRHYEKEKFYEEIWSAVMDSDLLFEEKDIKIFALGRIWADARIPYFCVKEGIKMSNEDFVNFISRNKKLLQEINFILSCKYDQRTQTRDRKSVV